MDGFLNLLKPPGMTSSDAVLYVRRLLPRGTKVGHGGTLDPDAAGVLPVCVGKATRLFDYFIDKEKEYVAEAVFGVSTDTQDASGAVVKRTEGEADAQEIRGKLPLLTGTVLQTPPAYSAIKQGGKRLYDLARKGIETQVPPREVQVLALDYLCKSGYNQYMFRVSCRKGVYVRTLMNDLGELLGCGAHMSFLLRTKAGAFTVDNALTLEEIARPGAIEAALMPLDAPLGYLPQVMLDESFRHAVTNGNPFAPPEPVSAGTLVRVYLQNEFAGIGLAGDEGLIRFKAMLL